MPSLSLRPLVEVYKETRIVQVSSNQLSPILEPTAGSSVLGLPAQLHRSGLARWSVPWECLGFECARGHVAGSGAVESDACLRCGLPTLAGSPEATQDTLKKQSIPISAVGTGTSLSPPLFLPPEGA